MNERLAESPLIIESSSQAFGFAETAVDPLELSERIRAALRSKRRSIAFSNVSRVSDKCPWAVSACSKQITASRLADRAKAFRPA